MTTMDEAYRKAKSTVKRRMRGEGGPKMKLVEAYRYLFDAGAAAERERCAQQVEGVQLVQHGGFPGSADFPEPTEIASMIREGARP